MISVIVTTHLSSNLPYLNRCLFSLTKQTTKNFEAVCISSAEERPTQEHHIHGIPLHWDQKLDCSSKKIEWAMNHINKASKYVVLLSDDVILSNTCLERMSAFLDAVNGNAIACPVSNSDIGSQFLRTLEVGGKALHPNMNLFDTLGIEQDLMAFNSTYMIAQRVDWFAFFCPMIPTKLFRDMGGLDPNLETRHNDQDFCLRARHHFSVNSYILHDAFAFHYGSKTLAHTADEEEKKKQSQYFLQKWGIK